MFPLLKSRNSGVVLAVASLFHYIGTGSSLEQEAVGRALVRVMRNHRGIQFIILSNISVFAATAPNMFRKYLKDFYAAVRFSTVFAPAAVTARVVAWLWRLRASYRESCTRYLMLVLLIPVDLCAGNLGLGTDVHSVHEAGHPVAAGV